MNEGPVGSIVGGVFPLAAFGFSHTAYRVLTDDMRIAAFSKRPPLSYC